MSSVQPFSFRDLGNGDAASVVVANTFVPSGSKTQKEEAPPPPPPPPTFSEEELKSAERDAYQKGFLDGIKEGKIQAENEQADIDRKLSAQVEKFSASIAPLFFDYREMAINVRREMPRVAQAIAEKMMASALSEEAISVVEHIVLRACEQMVGEPKLTVIVHETLAPTLKHQLKTLLSQQNEPMQILVATDSNIALSDCRIEWTNGSMERSTEKLWANVQQIIDNMSVASARDAEEQLSFLQGNMAITAPVPAPVTTASEPEITEPQEPTPLEQKE